MAEKSRPSEAEFEELKRLRDQSILRMVQGIAAELGCDPSEMTVHACATDGCYCDCPEGPCQHEFEGWREFDDGRGGERACKRCGMGAMQHSLRTAL